VTSICLPHPKIEYKDIERKLIEELAPCLAISDFSYDSYVSPGVKDRS
jgi:hypothetical protein